MQDLTKKQKAILKYVYSFHEKHGYQPSISEIAEIFEVTAPTIRQQLIVAEDKGFIIRTRKARFIEFTDKFKIK